MAILSQPAHPSEFPFLVSIRNHARHHCGGSLISRRSVVTAAHCIPRELQHDIRILTTGWSVEVGSNVIGHGNTHGISGAWVHPGYLPETFGPRMMTNDIGMITLRTPVILSPRVNTIRLPSPNARVPVGEYAITAGFGMPRQATPMSPVSKKSNLIITSLQECTAFYQRLHGKRIDRTQICARLGPGHGTCYGDSGGPLVHNNVLIGIVSAGDGMCGNGNPDIFTRVSSFVTSLHQQMAHDSGNNESNDIEDNSTQHEATISEALGKYGKKGVQESAEMIDENIIHLRKRLDLLRYKSDKLKKRLTLLLHEYKLLKDGKPIKIGRMKSSSSFLKKKIIKLENQLHRVGMLQLEAFTVGKKYRSIKTCLKSDAVLYASCLDDLERNIMDQETEMKRLKKVKREALELRDTTKETLSKHETQALYTSKERDSIIQDYRRRVEERKVDLERLSRAMFSTARSASRDELDSSRDTGRKTPKEPQRDEITETEVDQLEEMFAKLRDATGVSRTEEVLDRFLAQRDTKDKLKKLQITTEQEKVELEKTRQELAAEIEMHKFSETKEADKNAERLEKINKDIQEQQVRQMDAETKVVELETLSQSIGQKLMYFCLKFKTENELSMPDEWTVTFNPMNVLSQLQDFVNKFIEMAGGTEKYDALMESIMSDRIEGTLETSSELTKQTAVEDRPLFPLFPTVTTPALQAQPSEDEEDIPTRNNLKRQAQLLVDAKSRRKGFVFRR
ncbi:hypothetical protein QAD02_004299 [Eretmocerus hayati]|uniref:Uncharacterized protein n=1 Tax=Eretmocerus hayati TaxID=131215 RepID=A0ACC2NQE1_9HYME|nr:hypothetical protein QAD02_004299 [Eretmocerus hayati]